MTVNPPSGATPRTNRKRFLLPVEMTHLLVLDGALAFAGLGCAIEPRTGATSAERNCPFPDGQPSCRWRVRAAFYERRKLSRLDSQRIIGLKGYRYGSDEKKMGGIAPHFDFLMQGWN